jgi:hypothetical protein
MRKLLVILVAICATAQVRVPGPGGEGASASSGITFVNAASESPSIGTGTVTLSVTAGNLLYGFASDQSGGTALAVSDPQNGSWNLQGSQYGSSTGAGINTAQFSTANSYTGSLTIAITSNASNSNPVLTVYQFHGQTSATAVSTGSGNLGTSSPITSNAFSASAGNLILFGIGIHGTSTCAAGIPTGMTIPVNGNPSGSNGAGCVEYVIAPSSETTATLAWTGSSWVVGQAAVFH